MNDHNHRCQLDPSKCTQCPGDNLKGHIDSCHLLCLVANTIRQCGISRAGKEVECNGSLTFHNRSGHIIVLLSNGNSSLSLKDRPVQSPCAPGSEGYSALPPRWGLSWPHMYSGYILSLRSKNQWFPATQPPLNYWRQKWKVVTSYYRMGKAWIGGKSRFIV